MEPLKDQFFNPSFYDFLANTLKQEVSLDHKQFSKLISGYEDLELMDRLKQVGDLLHEILPGSFSQKLEVVKKVAPKVGGFPGMALPYFVEKYGVDQFDESMAALKFLTPFSSSEFAVRVFIKQDIEKALYLMESWASDSNNHVRRLASEGSRPLLPWSFKLDEVISNPDLTKPILSVLKEDQDLYVKKSVGNHLNDHAKKHPNWVIDCVNAWDLTNTDTLWIAKRGVRTLIKEGFPESFSIMGFEKNPKYKVGDLKLNTPNLSIGDTLEFTFELESDKTDHQKLSIDYSIYYRKKNGKVAPKVFKLKELDLAPMDKLLISKKQKFENLSTRKHYGGEHFVSIKINGVEQSKVGFNLICK